SSRSTRSSQCRSACARIAARPTATGRSFSPSPTTRRATRSRIPRARSDLIIAFDEKLAMSFGVRADRGSANGDREKFFSYPKYSASYRFVNPLRAITDKVDELKVRASFGQAGNRPNYGL